MVISYQSAWCYIFENNNLHSLRCKKLKYKKTVFQSLNLTEVWEAWTMIAGNDNKMCLYENVL